MQIKDIEIEFEGDTLTKYGLFALLAWFLVDIIELSKRFKIVTVKKRRNRKDPIKRRKKPFPDYKMCLGIVVIILLGIKRFEKIPRLLHTETKLAELIGLEKFFRVATARNFINEFTLWHLRQLDKINMGILKNFGEATLQDFPILDIDKSTHSLESKKREKAVPGFNKKNRGKPCYQWSCGFIREEVVTQKLHSGKTKADCFKYLEEIVLDAQKKLGIDNFIIRSDGGYLSFKTLDFIVNEGHQIVIAARYDWVLAQEGNELDEMKWIRHDDKTRLYELGLGKVVSKCQYDFRIILVEKEQEKIKIRKRKKFYRYALVSNLSHPLKTEALYEFYHQRQTIENFFKESKNPFNAGKMPSQKFRANEAYLHLVVIAYNCFSIFKKNICQATGKENLLKQLKSS